MSNRWYKVDNVAKLFIATSNRRDPRMFRVSATLHEPVQAELLNAALVPAARQFPQFQVTLHRGLFWHYFESTDELPVTVPETLPPCAPIYGPNRRNELLYRVTYFGNRINVEMFHALTDGNGGMLFLKAILYHYLQLCYPNQLKGAAAPGGASEADLEQNSYQNFYGNHPRTRKRRTKAYHIWGLRLPYDQLQYFEARMPVAPVLALARGASVSLSSYLGALLMQSIYREMPALERNKPITISMPVNLRNYYPSETARNFFNSVYITQTLTGEETLEQIAAAYDARLKEALQADNIRAGMDGYEKLEHMAAIRPVPLFIKNRVVDWFNALEGKGVTAVLSNMGRIPLEEELAPFVEGFSAFCTSDNMFVCVCSYGDELVLGVTSSYRSTSILKRVVRHLTEQKVPVTLYATEVQK